MCVDWFIAFLTIYFLSEGSVVMSSVSFLLLLVIHFLSPPHPPLSFKKQSGLRFVNHINLFKELALCFIDFSHCWSVFNYIDGCSHLYYFTPSVCFLCLVCEVRAQFYDLSISFLHLMLQTFHSAFFTTVTHSLIYYIFILIQFNVI